MTLTCSHVESNQTTSSNCPVKPLSDLRGPPGIPGSKGEPGFGKFPIANTAQMPSNKLLFIITRTIITILEQEVNQNFMSDNLRL